MNSSRVFEDVAHMTVTQRAAKLKKAPLPDFTTVEANMPH